MTSQLVWLAADYQPITLYSCRVPMSSQHSALVLPAPGPGTVRLACIRAAVERFGVTFTRANLFTSICSAKICICPPTRVAVTPHSLRQYKVTAYKAGISIDETIGYREFAHAEGEIRIHIQVPADLAGDFEHILRGIGYWGQSNSFVQCSRIELRAPIPGEYGECITGYNPEYGAETFWISSVMELTCADPTWNDVIWGEHTVLTPHSWIWPLVLCERRSTGVLWEYCSLLTEAKKS